MVCLDTSFLIALIRRDPDAEAKLLSFAASEEGVCTTPITACELYAGAFKSRLRESEAKKVKELLLRMEMLDFSVQACERFGRIRSQLEDSGTPIGDFDIMIGSIALAHNQPILTRDVEHFEKIPGLIVDTW